MRVATILPLAGAKVYTAHLFEQLPDCGEQPFRGDGEIAHADTRGVVDGIRHRRRDARRTQLTDPLGPQSLACQSTSSTKYASSCPMSAFTGTR